MKPRKRLFVALMGVTCLLIVGIIYLGWWIPTKGLENIHPDLPGYIGVIFAILSSLAILGTFLLTLTTALGKDIFFTRFMRLVVIKFLLPAIELLGRFLGIAKDTIRQSFVAMNNSLVESQKEFNERMQRVTGGGGIPGLSSPTSTTGSPTTGTTRTPAGSGRP